MRAPSISLRYRGGCQRAALFRSPMHEWRDGRAKLATIALLLALRRKEAELFTRGGYQPIVIEGDHSDWALDIFAFLKTGG